ncbi:putative Major facilitator superfamily (MFS) profile domain-containing protein [Seiridium cardinale]|uniref:Major facilitator superfamily (MFS) profile domain-containing protein n=1 Tax=Seiridium cardinale TaxID=138064 RepID=A0ABR2X966_9PEZI
MPTKERIYNWYVCMVAAMCMVLYGYDASVFNAAQNSTNWLAWMNIDPKKDAYLLGLVNTAYTIGAILAGWFAGGPIADAFGRRVGMATGCLLTVVATLMQTFSPYHTLGVFIAGRVLIGIGQGIALTAGPVYINEMAPSEIRGTIMTFWQLNYSVGSFIAYWIAFATGKYKARLGEWDWKMIVIFQMLVPIIIMVLLPFQPDSPRWYIKRHNNVEAARNVLRKIRASHQEAEDEILAIQEAIEFEKEAISSNYSALFKDRSVRKRLFLAFIINMGQQLTGQGTLNSYSSAIYKQIWPDTNTINLINALNATCGILFTLNAAWTADRYGRRWLLIVGAIGMAVCMLIVPVIGLATPDINGVKSNSVGIGIVFMLFLFTFFYKPSWGATVWIWTAEIFSVNVRAQAVGMCSQMQNVANTIFSQFFPTFLNNVGLKCLFFFMAMNILLGVFVFFFIPETKGVPLEEIDAVFGGQNHVEKGGDIMGIPDAHHANLGTDVEKNGTEIQQTERAREIGV